MIMRKKHKLSNCECVPDCNDVYFTFKEKEAPIDVDRLCDRHSETYRYVQEVDDRVKYPFLGRYYDKTVTSMDRAPRQLQYCLDRVRDMVGISVHYATQRYVKHQQNKRVTFSDKVAHLGKENKDRKWWGCFYLLLLFSS